MTLLELITGCAVICCTCFLLGKVSLRERDLSIKHNVEDLYQ